MASWWNPFSWFNKKAVQAPIVQVVQTSTPTPVTDYGEQIKDLQNKIAGLKKKATQSPASNVSAPDYGKQIADLQKQINELKKELADKNQTVSVNDTNTTTKQVISLTKGKFWSKKGDFMYYPAYCPGRSMIKEEYKIWFATEQDAINAGFKKLYPSCIIKSTTTTSTATQNGGSAIYGSSVSAIDTFLANPTLESLKTFCTSAKTLPGIGQTKVFNEARTDYITKTRTLYEQVGICAIALGENKDASYRPLHWISYNPSYLVSFDNPNESDMIRAIKIKYNTEWKSLSKYKLIGFFDISSYYHGTPDAGVTTPNQMVEKIIGTGSQYELQLAGLGIQRLFLVPEKTLSLIRTQLINGK